MRHSFDNEIVMIVRMTMLKPPPHTLYRRSENYKPASLASVTLCHVSTHLCARQHQRSKVAWYFILTINLHEVTQFVVILLYSRLRMPGHTLTRQYKFIELSRHENAFTFSRQNLESLCAHHCIVVIPPRFSSVWITSPEFCLIGNFN